jgi:hypothetical protein
MRRKTARSWISPSKEHVGGVGGFAPNTTNISLHEKEKPWQLLLSAALGRR